MASHVSSGSFVQVMGETFLVLTQYKNKPPQDLRFPAACSSKVLVSVGVMGAGFLGVSCAVKVKDAEEV